MNYYKMPVPNNTLDWFVGFDCNLRCGYCNLDKSLLQYRNGVDKLDKVLEKYKHHNINNITISGGEPTLYKEEVIGILEKYSNKYFITIISNGKNYDILQEFLKYPVGIILSYDGHENDRGYDSWDTLCKLWDKGQLYQVSMVIGNKNYNKLYEILTEMEDRCPGLVSDWNRTKMNIARCENSYYKMDFDILKEQLQKCFNKFPNMWNFRSRGGLCKNYFEWVDAHVCSHFTGDVVGQGCYGKFSNKEEILHSYFNKCYKCENEICWAHTCPNSIDALKLKVDEDHLFCKYHTAIQEMKNEKENNDSFNEMVGKTETLEIIMTENCNLRCEYCFEKKKVEPCVISKEVIDNLFRDITPKINSNHIDFDILGGEPIMPSTLEARKHLLKKIKEDKSRTYICMMSTNGIDFCEEDFKWLMDIINNHNSDVILQFSIDGVKEVQDRTRKSLDGKSCFDRCVRNLKKLVDEYGFPKEQIRILTVLHHGKGNSIERLPDWLEWASKELVGKYVQMISFNALENLNKKFTEEDYEEVKTSLTEVYKRYLEGRINIGAVKNLFINGTGKQKKDIKYKNCGMCRDLWVLCPNGDIIPCHYFLEDKYREKYTIYNVLDKKMNKDARNIINECVEPFNHCKNIDNEYCEDCQAFNECFLCKAAQMVEGGDMYTPLQYECDFYYSKLKICKELFGDRFTIFTPEQIIEFEQDYEKINSLYENETDINKKNEYLEILKQMSLVYLERRDYVDIHCTK